MASNHWQDERRYAETDNDTYILRTLEDLAAAASRGLDATRASFNFLHLRLASLGNPDRAVVIVCFNAFNSASIDCIFALVLIPFSADLSQSLLANHADGQAEPPPADAIPSAPLVHSSREAPRSTYRLAQGHALSIRHSHLGLRGLLEISEPKS